MKNKVLLCCALLSIIWTARAQTPVGVTQIQAGTNVTLSPSSGTGIVTINASGGSGAFNALTGDATSTATGGATTVKGLNNTLLSGLGTGLLKNTTGTGVPSIAVSGTDYQAPPTRGTVLELD